jgi:PAS domain S-box-containing protein
MTPLSRKSWIRILSIAFAIGLIDLAVMLLREMALRSGLELPFWLEAAVNSGLVAIASLALFRYAGALSRNVCWAGENRQGVFAHGLKADLLHALDENTLVSICDIKGNITYANEKFCLVSGYTEAELMGQNHRITRSGQHERSYYEALWRTITAGQPWHGELCNRRKDGSLYWMDTTITPYLDADGKPYQFVSVRRDITDLKATQGKAQRLGERLQWLLDASPAVVYAHENPANLAECTFISGNVCSMVGYTPSQMLTASGFWLSHLHPGDRTEAKSALSKLLAIGHATLEYRFLSATGDYRWICDRSQLIRDGQSAPYAIVGSWTDVTDGKAAELERRRLRMAVESSTDMIFLTDAKGVIEYVNPAFCQFTGWQSAEIVGKTPKILQSGRTPTPVYQDMLEALLRGKPWQGRLCNRCKEGAASASPAAAPSGTPCLPHRRKNDPIPAPTSPAEVLLYWADVTITPIFDEVGVHLGFVSFQRDISATVAQEERQAIERMDTEARLAIVEILNHASPLAERYARVLERLFDLPDLALQKKGGVFLRNNETGKLDMYLLRGEFSEAFIRAEQSIRLGACLCGQAAESGELLVSNDCFCDPRHEHRFEGMNAHGHYIVPLSSGSDIMGVLFLYTEPYPDFSPHRIAMLKQVGEYLGLALIRDQTRKMIEKARDAALDASRQKGEFLANMSHEIRTPMNGVLGMLELLRRSKLAPEQQEFADMAAYSAETLMDVINSILDFSKIEAGKLELDNVDFNVRDLVEEVCSMLAAPAHSKALELTCFVEPGVPGLVCGDPTRLRQVLLNLVGNAIKFTREGEVSVEAVCLSQEESRAVLLFSVKDTGIGISAEERARLFRPFEQADGATTRRFGGTGLGLSISKSLINRMGGDIHVDSVPGEGSTFGFTVALEKRQEADAAPLNQLSRRRVLVVDDNATNRIILQRFLMDWGAEVSLSGMAAEALAKLKHAQRLGNPFELVILDLHMPEMDGLMLGRAMAQDEGLAATPRILLSSGAMVGEEERAEAGIRQALTKPVRQSQLFDAVVSSLQEGWNKMTGDKLKNKPDLPHFADKKILMVEDNLINQKVALKMLNCFGLQAELAGNGRDALAELARQHYDLVLMDCHMPEMDGYATTQALRERERLTGQPRTPVVALTANALTGEREKCIEAGMDDYLAKPFLLEDMAETLTRWLSEEAPPGAAEPPIWDAAAALERLGGDRELLDEMKPLFVTEAVKHLECLAESNPPETVASAAHTLKGMAMHFCAHEVVALAAEVEQLGRSGQIDSQLSAQLTRAAERLAAALQEDSGD